ncbi:MAG: BatD family protein [Bacteroidaceae bacterium]|nr:BatD family protein [Bacteroidaceae bacterium]
MILSVFAENYTLTVRAASTVEEGDKFRIQFTVNSQDVSNFSAPDFKGFEVIYGPSTSSQSSWSMVNGHTSQSSSITYTYVLLASRVGTFNVSPASVQVDGQTVKSRPFSIKVLPAGQGSSSRNTNSSGVAGGRQSNVPVTTGNNISTNQLFMTATASRTSVYEQEAILLTYKLYTQVDIRDLDGKLPTLDGFQVQQLPLPRNQEMEIENYNGRNYRTIVWCQYVLYPQKSGKLVIPSITYEGLVVQRNPNINPIDAFFNGTSGLMELRKKITTPRLTINVSPLPTKPDNFSGAVGNFTLSSTLTPTELVANDAITMKIQLKGSGNMKLISAPNVAFPKDFETYDVKVNDNFNLTKGGLSGTKEFEYLAVPRNPGKYTIPAASFVFFDPKSKTYKTLRTEEYTINVKKGAGNYSKTINDYSNQQQDVKELGQDIRYIKTGDVELVRQGDSFFGSMAYILCYVVPFVIFVLGLVLGRRTIRENANVAKSRGKKANKMALKRMKSAAKLLNSNSHNEFYDEVMRALWGYISDKFNMPLESLNKDNVQSELLARGVSQEVADTFIKALNDCEFARYAPGDAASNMQAVYDGSINAITKIEDNL